MGQQCCEKLGGKKPVQQPQQTKKTQLVRKDPLTSHQNTRNDKEFTYFKGVFELLSLGEKLQLPQYVDELHPEFSYEKFNATYHAYQKQIVNLGLYIEQYRKDESQLSKRIRQDINTIKKGKELAKVEGDNRYGCLVKLELQDVRWNAAKEVGIVLTHPLSWEGKFERWIRKQMVEAGPIFMQFAVPEIKGAIVKISGRPGKGEIVFDLEDCFNNWRQLFCKVMKWKGVSDSQGIALRMQLVNEDQKSESQKFLQMVDLHDKLVKDYGVDGQINMSVSEKDINDRLSRHRTSLNKKYNMGKNSML